MAEKLTETERAEALADLPGWQFDAAGDAITRRFVFADFVAAFGFMAQVAILAEKAGHHPDWSNSYNKVSISLSTHDAGEITRKDIDLAAKISKLAPAQD